MFNTSALSKIAAAKTLEHKFIYAWEYLTDINVQYCPIDSYSRTPIAAAEMIWAHGRYGPRKTALKKIDAIHIVCMFLVWKAGEA
ncbi:hypothetical protein Aba10324_17180 [Acinetobacter baumannii]|uniref:hypothetical protein n=1 Tax=Acinetobacter baumannii TaxID=470 RepID=UPI000E5929BC|nr:hypothetical protein [Acinetobacter baumannii]AXX46523.1 hypothetical protein Aba10324_17180 [Acinetobacter baumannii]MCZ3087196.1 hypothetical protein [Acinetobacter baumannii]